MGGGASAKRAEAESRTTNDIKEENEKLRTQLKAMKMNAGNDEPMSSPVSPRALSEIYEVHHQGSMVYMERPIEDPRLHPDIVIYGGTVCDALPFPACTASRVVAEIDLTSISENALEVQRAAAKTNRKIMGIVEANAYGHGAVPIAHMLVQCNEIDFFGVATVNEGIELRMSGLPPDVRILVWITHSSEWQVCADYSLDVCVTCEAMVEELIQWCGLTSAAGELQQAMRVHVLLNTGVSRLDPTGLGLQMYSEGEDESADNQKEADAVAALIKCLDDDLHMEFVGIMAHLVGDIEHQLDRFKQVVDTVRANAVRIPMIHLDNSQALLAGMVPESYVTELLRGPGGDYDTMGYCSAGGALYGQRPQFDSLKPCITLKAQIRHVHLCKRGCPVGYERAWYAPEDVIIATLSVGFADGYARLFSNAGSYGKSGVVTINGHVCPIVGKVCMDMIMVNCGPLGSESGQAPKVGEYAILFGKDGESLEATANIIGTTLPDITCDFTRRIERSYTRPPQPKTGYFVCTSIEESRHPELLYGGISVGSVPFPHSCQVRVKLEVDLGAISQNARQVQKVCARTGRKLMGIVKANAYGMGAVAVSHMLMKVNGFDFFGVASINEAIELRMSGIPESVRILVLGASTPTEWKSYSYYDLDIGVQSQEMAMQIVAWATEELRNDALTKPLRVHILLNTGMSRLGLQTYSPEIEEADLPEIYENEVGQAAQVVKFVDDADKNAIQFYALMTHMCDAHKGIDFTQRQFTRFKRVVDAVRELGIRIPMLHMENSEATLENLITDEQVREVLEGPGPEKLYDTQGYCRSGGGMYGQRNFDFLRPTCSLKAQVRNVHKTGDGRIIATVAAGYADGFSKEFGKEGSYGKGGAVGIHGEICNIAGRICMDVLTVDCGPEDSMAGSMVKVGDYAVLFGEGGPSLKDAAGMLTTAQSDVTCDLTRRPERYYYNAPPPVLEGDGSERKPTQCESALARATIRLSPTAGDAGGLKALTR